jgi:hypothetical protein
VEGPLTTRGSFGSVPAGPGRASGLSVSWCRAGGAAKAPPFSASVTTQWQQGRGCRSTETRPRRWDEVERRGCGAPGDGHVVELRGRSRRAASHCPPAEKSPDISPSHVESLRERKDPHILLYPPSADLNPSSLPLAPDLVRPPSHGIPPHSTTSLPPWGSRGTTTAPPIPSSKSRSAAGWPPLPPPSRQTGLC